MGSKGSYVLPTSPVDAVSSTSTSQGRSSPAAELDRILAKADWVNAYAHHRQAALHHEREAEWHRAEMRRLEGEA